MQASQLASRAWSLRPAKVASQAASSQSLTDQLAAAIAYTEQHGRFGDVFVFGRCADEYERALASGLPADARVFACVEGRSPRLRGRIGVEAGALDERAVMALRARHHVQRVSALVVADDFGWSLGRVVHTLRSLIATHAVLLVAGKQAALLEAMWLDELRRGQSEFDVGRMSEPASAWARLTLHHRQFA